MPRADRPSSARTDAPWANEVAGVAGIPAAPVGGWGAAVDHRAGREGSEGRARRWERRATGEVTVRRDRGQLLATSRLWREATRRLRERAWRRCVPPWGDGGAPLREGA